MVTVALMGRALQEGQRIRAEATESARHIRRTFPHSGLKNAPKGTRSRNSGHVGMASGRRGRWSSNVFPGSVVGNGAAVGWVVAQGEFQTADHQDAIIVLIRSCLGLTASEQSVVLLV